MISDMPYWEDKVIRRYTGCTLHTLVKHYDSPISPFYFPEIPTLVALECQSCLSIYLPIPLNPRGGHQTGSSEPSAGG